MNKIEELMRRDSILWFLILAFCLILFCYRLGERSLSSAQEGRAGIIARNMITTGNYMETVIYGDETNQKPIFYYWLVALSCLCFKVSEFAIRFPSVIAAIVSVFFITMLGKQMYDRNTGFLAGFMLTVSVGFQHMARTGRIDIVLTSMITICLYLFYMGYAREQKGNWLLYLFYLTLGISILTKGPVGLALLGPVIVLYAIVTKDYKLFWKIKPLSGSLILFIVVTPWFFYIIQKTHGEFFRDFFMLHNIERFLGIKGSFSAGKHRSFFFYVPKLFAVFLPWSLFLPFSIWYFYKKIQSKVHQKKIYGMWQNFSRIRKETLLLILFVSFSFLFFSCAAFKRGDYLLPIYPPLVLLVARYIVILQEKVGAFRFSLKLQRASYSIFVLLVVCFIIFYLMLLTGIASEFARSDLFLKYFNRKDQAIALELFRQSSKLLFLFISIIIPGSFIVRFFSQRAILRGTALMVLVMGIAGFGYTTVEPSIDRCTSFHHFCNQIVKRVGNQKIQFYQLRCLEIKYYLNRDMDTIVSTKTLYEKINHGKLQYLIIEKDRFNHLPIDIRKKFSILEQTPDYHRKKYYFVHFKNDNG